MKLAALYNSWDDFDLLKLSIDNIRPLVDVVIVIFSTTSNYGEHKQGPDGSDYDDWSVSNVPIFFRQLEPNFKKSPRDNETAKRNNGLFWAREFKCTHFIMLDSDEFYERDKFLLAKYRFHVEPNLKGLVCNCQTYFKSPKLTIGLDTTLVPFIHELTPTIRHEFNKNYPFAWEGKAIRIDPTRSLNITKGVERTDLIMHHYSWVRKDYQKKIRNSTARTNLERSCILKDLVYSKEGYFVEYYQKPLVRATVDFNIPEYEFDEGGNATIRKDL